MAWTDKIQNPSFRGVPFLVDNTAGDGGRRTTLHEYPQRDTPYSEDMGRKAKTFTIEAFVVGDDYIDQAKNLREALDQEGSGELIHPFYGSLTVNCASYSERYSSAEGRVSRFTITFEEAGERFYPEQTKNNTAAVNSAADNAATVTAEVFAEDFSVEGAPGYVTQDAISIFSDFADGLDAASSFISNITSFLKTPLMLARQVQSILSSLDSLKDQLSFGSFGSRSTSTSQSNTELMKKTNRDAIITLIRQSAVEEAAKTAVTETYESRTDAEAVQDSLVSIIDAETEITESTETYVALVDLRAQVVEAIPEEGLPEMIEYEVTRTMSSLTLAYELYGDAQRGDEIVLRNKVRHPGFIGVGAVQVITS